MSTRKARQILEQLNQTDMHVRRRGVDKSLPAELLDISQTQEIKMTDSDADTIEESSSSDTEPIFDDEEAMEVLSKECKAWISEFAPKMFNLAVSQWLTKQEKRKQKNLSEISPTCSLLKTPRKKKQKTSDS